MKRCLNKEVGKNLSGLVMVGIVLVAASAGYAGKPAPSTRVQRDAVADEIHAEVDAAASRADEEGALTDDPLNTATEGFKHTVLGETVISDHELSQDELIDLEREIVSSRELAEELDYTVLGETIISGHELTPKELFDLEREIEASQAREIEEEGQYDSDIASPDRRRLRVDKDRSLPNMVERSDLVFRGVVEAIQYKLSEPVGAEQARQPYTFVTYRVDEVLHGSIEGDHITLQFFGGWNEETQHYTATSITPQFDLDDDDILFVKGNTKDICPLVDHRQGRLRVVDHQVYTESGSEVTLDETDILGFGPRRALEEVMTTNVNDGMMILRHGVVPDTLEGATASVDAQRQALGRPSNAAPVDVILNRLATLGHKRRTGRFFVNADPSVTIAGLDLTPAAPPVPEPDELEGNFINPVEANE